MRSCLNFFSLNSSFLHVCDSSSFLHILEWMVVTELSLRASSAARCLSVPAAGTPLVRRWEASVRPGGYQPYPVDDQDAPGFGWASEPSPRGSGSSTRTPTSIPTPTQPVRGTRTPYTPGEMMAMFKAYCAVSEDPEVGTNQTGKTYWRRITRLYNEIRPGGTIYRNDSMVRNCLYRCNETISKFQGYYL